MGPFFHAPTLSISINLTVTSPTSKTLIHSSIVILDRKDELHSPNCSCTCTIGNIGAHVTVSIIQMLFMSGAVRVGPGLTNCLKARRGTDAEWQALFSSTAILYKSSTRRTLCLKSHPYPLSVATVLG